jgi:hypothetical protein
MDVDADANAPVRFVAAHDAMVAMMAGAARERPRDTLG